MSDYLKGIGMVFLSLSLAAVVACGGGAATAPAEEAMAVEEDAATNTGFIDRQLPNPTSEVITQWAELPDGRTWGSTAGIDIGPDGHIWVYDRCGANGLDGGCEANSDVDPILKYDRHTGEILANFGAGLFVLPHGLHVDDDGNVWVTDSQGNDAGTKGHQVIKFSPEGEVLMTLGEAGTPGTGPGQLNEPCDVITAPNGDIFIADGYGNSVVHHYASDGNYIKSFGAPGEEFGEFSTPHGIWVDADSLVYVADRENNSVQIFDTDGKFITAWTDFYHPMDLWQDQHGMFYVTDQTSRVSVLSPDGTLISRTRAPDAGHGIYGDSQGNLYLSAAFRGIAKMERR